MIRPMIRRKIRRKIRTVSRVLGVAAAGVPAALLSIPGPALAQEFVKVEDAAREQLPATPFVAVAYGFIWLAVLVYLLSVARRLGQVKQEIEDLRRRIDGGGRSAAPGAGTATGHAPSPR